MPDDEPKSAIEIAMERLRARGDLSAKTLTDDQKAEIAEIRNRYRARIAELEIKQQEKLTLATSYEELETLREELVREKNRLNEGMEDEVERARNRQS